LCLDVGKPFPREYFFAPGARTDARVSSPLDNLFIAFRDDELDEVDQLFSQAKLVLDARSVIQQQ
jgi:hypothetical protein